MKRAALLAALIAGLGSLVARSAAAADGDAGADAPAQPQAPAPSAAAPADKPPAAPAERPPTAPAEKPPAAPADKAPADPASPTPAELIAKPPASPPLPNEASPRRALPDYEGRPGPPTTFGDVAIWVPRIVFSPVYFVSEFVIRRPLGALVTAAERANIPSFLYDFFAFGPEHKAGFAPLAFVDLGFNPSVGILLFWNDAFFKGNDLSLHASTWGTDWLAGGVTEKIRFADKKTLTFALTGYRRPDRVFYGLGPNTLQSSQSRFGENYADGTASLDVPLWRASKIRTSLSLRKASFYDGHHDRDPNISHQVQAGVFALPPGFADGYTAETSSVMLALDSRRAYPDDGSGVRLEAQVSSGNDVSQSPASGWLRTDAAAAGYVDLDGHRRVVSLEVESSIVEPLGPGPIPFTELVSLGGDTAPMPGFYIGRLVDRSAAVATLRYRWPIGPFLSGSMQAALGNVFGVRLEDFDPKLLRLSAALGIESDQAPDAGIHLLVGFGTETFDHGGQVDSFRLAFGTSRF